MHGKWWAGSWGWSGIIVTRAKWRGCNWWNGFAIRYRKTAKSFSSKCWSSVWVTTRSKWYQHASKPSLASIPWSKPADTPAENEAANCWPPSYKASRALRLCRYAAITCKGPTIWSPATSASGHCRNCDLFWWPLSITFDGEMMVSFKMLSSSFWLWCKLVGLEFLLIHPASSFLWSLS